MRIELAEMCRSNFVFAVLAGAFLTGCASAPVNTWLISNGETEAMRAVMARKDKLVYLSTPALDPAKPVLLLLHGATDDPSEMLDIVREWRGKYNTLLYSFNYHQPVEKVALHLVREMKTLKAEIERLEPEGRPVTNVTVVTYSYSAIVFRKAVLVAEAPTPFSGVSLIQLVPNAGGSFQARGMRNPVVAGLVWLASNPSVAENPYGRFAENLWEGAGDRKFNEVINPRRVRTVLLEDDFHSVTRLGDKAVLQRYKNGIGTNIVVIPKSSGVSHEYFPTEPAALAYLRKLLETTPAQDCLNVTTPSSGAAFER